MGSEPQYAKWPLLPLSQHVFTVTNPYASRPNQEVAAKKLQDAIEEHKMAPLYRYLAHPIEGILNSVGEGGASAPGKPLSRKSSAVGMIASKSPTSNISIPWDEGVYQKLKEDNDKEFEGYQKEEDEAVEKAGDTEIMAARGKRAEFWARVGDKVCLLFSFDLRQVMSNSFALGESNRRLRRCFRKDRYPGHQDRSRPGHNTYGPILRRQAAGEEGG